MSHRTQIWAHRGASAYAPENTLEAFALARDMHSDGIELDVHCSADGEIIVCHDASINRTSNGAGSIAQMTLEQLRQFSFSGNFASQYPNVKIPTLDEVFELVYPTDMVVNVEIKATGKGFAERLHKCISDCKMEERVIYSSFHHEMLFCMLELDKNAFVAPLYGEGPAQPWEYAKRLGAKALHPHFNGVYAVSDYIKRCHENQIRVHPWTVDDQANILRLLETEADAIITNRPDFAKKLRDGND